ncbi:protein of unknown function [Rhodovastum atsumiense]|nr:protein of unknown function [Rhodovastum atsumiense]
MPGSAPPRSTAWTWRRSCAGHETEPQAAWLEGLGCRLGQGFLFAPALPADAFARLWRQQTAAAAGAPARRAECGVRMDITKQIQYSEGIGNLVVI